MSTAQHTHPATTSARPRGWRDRAACRDTDPELFFPTGRPGAPGYERQAARAKKVCRRCPVRDACLAEAFERLPHGVAGGLTELERDQARRNGASGRHSGQTAEVR